MIVRVVLSMVMAVAGSVFAMRVFAGPLTAPLKVNNPLHAEAWFALGLLFTMLVTADSSHGSM